MLYRSPVINFMYKYFFTNPKESDTHLFRALFGNKNCGRNLGYGITASKFLRVYYLGPTNEMLESYFVFSLQQHLDFT